MNILISNSDIEEAERRLLPIGCSFDEERRSFIRELSSCDVVACPGSGKTTALLAKLVTLSKKMPFLGGGGVCVLTHTNVAIDEIKIRLGAEAESLISYPNFFGTIQSFINRFLAIPCYVETYGSRPHTIDSERHISKLVKSCLASSARGWIYQKVRSPAYESPASLLSYIQLDSDTLEFDLTGIKLVNPNSPTYRAISNKCQQVMKSGVVSYRQAYALAKHYLNKHPSLPDLLTKRFRFVLIDEMQDSYSHQIEILNLLFPESVTVVQRVGDPNQAIFSMPKDGEMEWVPREPTLTFSNSMRFGESLSSLLAPIRVDSSMALAGNPNIESYPPHILTYNDSNIGEAVSAFAVLIQNLGLDTDSIIASKTFKAVGWVGKYKETACIPHYWPSYAPKLKVKPRFSNLISYIVSYQVMTGCSYNPRLFKAYIMEGLTRLANRCLPINIKGPASLTAYQFERWLRSECVEDFVLISDRLAVWLLGLASGEQVEAIHDNMVGFLTSETVFSKHLSPEAISFITDKDIAPECSQDETCNLLCCSDRLEVEVGTVHSVKGETHTGTLLLETKYQRKHDSEYLMPLLRGGTLPQSAGIHLKSCVKIAHVAMSRPTHLFVLACHESRIEGHEDALKALGWEIVSAQELLQINR
jgi:hypothetical protein